MGWHEHDPYDVDAPDTDVDDDVPPPRRTTRFVGDMFTCANCGPNYHCHLGNGQRCDQRTIYQGD